MPPAPATAAGEQPSVTTGEGAHDHDAQVAEEAKDTEDSDDAY